MTNNVFCCELGNGICPYKQEFLNFHKDVKCNYKCSSQDKKDYQGYNSKKWHPGLIKLFYTSTCPMVSINWWINKATSKQP